MDERKRKKRRIFWVSTALLLILCLYGYATGWDAWSQVNGRLAEAREMGFPVEPEDIFHPTEIDDAENAAVDYEAMSKLYSTLQPTLDREKADRAYEYYRGRLGYSAFDAAYLLDFHQEYIQLAEQATTKPSLRLRKDWSDPLSALVPELAAGKQAASLFLIRALTRLEGGDTSSALEDLHRVRVLCQQLRTSGTSSAHLVACAIERMYAHTVQVAVSTSGVDFRLHDGLLQDLSSWPEKVDFTQPIRFAAFQATWLSRHVGQLRGDDARPPWRMMQGLPSKSEEWEQFAWNLPKVQAEATQVSLDHWMRVLTTYDVDSDDPVAWAVEMDSDLPIGSGYSQAASALSRMVSQEVTNLATRSLEEFARRRVLVSALRILRHPGSSPEGFLDVDPFTGSKLKYKKTPTGFVVYSVGKDRVDNDGETSGFAKSGFDIAFKYPFIRKAR